MKKILILTITLLITFQIIAQVSITVKAAAGKLSSSLTAEEKNAVTNLAITGIIDSSDFITMYNMPALAVLDLSEVDVVGNAIPDSIFLKKVGENYIAKTSLTSIILPKTVTAIGNSAFQGCTSMASLMMGDSIKSIGDYAFYNCRSLTGSFKFPKNIKSIGNYAFYSCSFLTGDISFPSYLTSIGEYAFGKCSGITSVTIPSNVISIGYCTFYDCEKIADFHVDSNNGRYYDIEGVLYDNTIEKLIAFPAAKSNTCIIPDGIASIEDNAFIHCKNLTAVSIPNSVRYIGRQAFFSCSNLTSMVIPNNVEAIGNMAFSGCSGLLSINIPDALDSISDYMLSSCSKLTSITIPNNVDYIGNYAFAKCTALTEIHCRKETPILLYSDNAFYNGPTYNECALFVPTGFSGAYSKADVWKNFTTISEETVSIIAYTSEDMISIANNDGIISIKTKKFIPVSIYTISGKKVYEKLINMDTQISLRHGIYIIKAGNQSKKIRID